MTSVEMETIVVDRMQQVDEADDILNLHLNHDPYTFVIALIDKEILSKLQFKKKVIIIYSFMFSFFVQFTGVLLFLSLDVVHDEMNVSIQFEGSDDIQTAVISTVKSLSQNDSYGFVEYLSKIVTICILAAYIYKDFGSSFADLTVIATFSKRWYLHVIYSLYQLFILYCIVYRIGFMIERETDIIDTMTLGIGFIILLEVDDYIFEAIHPIIINDDDDEFVDLFTVKIKNNNNEIKNCLYDIHSKTLIQCISLCLWSIFYPLALVFEIFTFNYIHKFNLVPQQSPGFIILRILCFIMFGIAATGYWYPVIIWFRMKFKSWRRNHS